MVTGKGHNPVLGSEVGRGGEEKIRSQKKQREAEVAHGPIDLGFYC